MKKFKALLTIALAAILLLSFSMNAATANSLDGLVKINGVEVVVHQPPEDFNALTATDEELAYYFYPPRPTDPAELKEWERNVDFKWVMPTFEEAKVLDEKSGEKKDIQFYTNTDTGNWAGYAKNASAGRVTASWTIPAITAATANRPAFTSQWIGLGGLVGDPLMQAGTYQSINSSGTIDRKVWYEILGTNLPTAAVFLTSIPISASDTFFSELSYAPSVSPHPSGVLTIAIGNTTQGIGTTFCPPPINYASYLSTAEWIMERPTVSGVYLYDVNLANGGTTFSGAKWAATPTGTLANVTDTTSTIKLTMKNEPRTVTLASPGATGSGSFTVSWYNYK